MGPAVPEDEVQSEGAGATVCGTDLDRQGWEGGGGGLTDGEDSPVRPPPEQPDPDMPGMFRVGDRERQIQSSSHGAWF